MYTLEYSEIHNEWFVVNTKTRDIQSCWNNKIEAMKVIKSLNKMVSQ